MAKGRDMWQGWSRQQGLPAGGKPIMFSLRSGGPQEGRLFDNGGGAVSTFAPDILRITDGQEGRAGAPSERSRTLQ